jgi:hypothetical protein
VSARPIFTELFHGRVKKHSSEKKKIEDKVRVIISNPLVGEPLKGDKLGLFSYPVAKNLLIIYSYCKDCRLKSCQDRNGCEFCEGTPDDTVVFIFIAPHDEAYEQMTRFRK